MKQYEENRKANGILIVCVIVTVIAVTLLMWARKNVPVFGEDLCIVGRVPAGVTFVLIDKTDPMTLAQREHVLMEVRRLGRTTLPNEMVAVYTLRQPEYGVLNEVFCACNPGSGKDANQLIANPGRREKRYRELFEGPLDSAITRAVTDESGARSAIIEGLADITRLAEFRIMEGPKRIWIFSDMLQHSERLSLYTTTAPRSFIEYNISSEAVPNLDGAEVSVFELERVRDRRLQGPRLEAFWTTFLSRARAGASASRYVRVLAGESVPPTEEGRRGSEFRYATHQAPSESNDSTSTLLVGMLRSDSLRDTMETER